MAAAGAQFGAVRRNSLRNSLTAHAITLQHEEKLIARKKAAEEREKVRLAELEEHRKRVEAKAEEERKALIAQQQKKEERVNLWAAKEKEKQVRTPRAIRRNPAQFSGAILLAMP